jgi:hypothetical protein
MPSASLIRIDPGNGTLLQNADTTMTALEQQTLASGFRICLLGVRASRGTEALAYHATLFDGGRALRTVQHEGNYFRPPEALLNDLRQLVLDVATPPHVLAAHGAGWRELLCMAIPPQILAELRILDLIGTARTLRGPLPPRCDIDAIRRAYQMGPGADADSPSSPAYEDILWAVIAHAGQRGLDWPGLLATTQNSRAVTSFARYAFTEEDLATVPEAPGVYVMRDAGGEELYVGKSANLARRLNEYFRPASALTSKIQAIRDRIRSFEYRLVGSELEALLHEHRMISQMPAGLNVQRSVAEGASRYAFPLTPVAILCASTVADAVEVIFCGARNRAWQCRVSLKRPPRRLLERLVAHCTRGVSPPPAGRTLIDWGVEGNEICCRYFARFRERLTWLELDVSGGSSVWVQALLDIIRRTGANLPEPGEFRL